MKNLPYAFRAIFEHDSGYRDPDIAHLHEALSILSSEISILKSRDIESKEGETLCKCSVLTASNVLPLQNCYTIRSYVGYHLSNFDKGSATHSLGGSKGRGNGCLSLKNTKLGRVGPQRVYYGVRANVSEAKINTKSSIVMSNEFGLFQLVQERRFSRMMLALL